ncbi:hypothetical protein AA18890_3420 [Komagataeibacter europaeus LMG 18890]|nr:hypothetical protein AA18890_3420 [Komagataeibacter europaeus LMG 18890]
MRVQYTEWHNDNRHMAIMEKWRGLIRAGGARHEPIRSVWIEIVLAKSLIFMEFLTGAVVGATGIEPVTPTMSR